MCLVAMIVSILRWVLMLIHAKCVRLVMHLPFLVCAGALGIKRALVDIARIVCGQYGSTERFLRKIQTQGMLDGMPALFCLVVFTIDLVA